MKEQEAVSHQKLEMKLASFAKCFPQENRVEI